MEKIFCPYCGLYVESTARFCNMCGSLLKASSSAVVKAALAKAEQLLEDLKGAGKVEKLAADVCSLLKLEGRDDYVAVEVERWIDGETYEQLVKLTIDGTSHFDHEVRVNRFFIHHEEEDRARALIESAYGCAGLPRGPGVSDVSLRERVYHSRVS